MSIEALKNGICGSTEPRRASHGNIRHRLEDIIIIALCAIICGGEDFIDIEFFGKERKEWLKGFLELPNGIPDSDIFRRLFERLNPAELSNCLSNWLEVERNKGSVVAVDGKTIRGGGNFRADMKSEESLDKGHGRIERREYRLLHDISWPEGCGEKTIRL